MYPLSVESKLWVLGWVIIIIHYASNGMKRDNQHSVIRALRVSPCMHARSAQSVLSFTLLIVFIWYNTKPRSDLDQAVTSSEQWVVSRQAKATQATRQSKHTQTETYADWRERAVELAKLSPEDALRVLQTEDPFETRAFAKRLADAEAENGGPLPLNEFKALFGDCPVSRLSYPDQRDHTKSANFRAGQGFLFFQHLRKAGGTHFCTVVNDNLPKANLPPYFCMPDKAWSWANKTKIKQPRAGRLHHWTNDEIVANIGPYRIAANEWDSFDPTAHFELPAIFVTSFRKPVDRAVSQFRFECIERNMCQSKKVMKYWRRRKDLHNVYAWTFSDIQKQASFANGTTMEAVTQRATSVGIALDTMVQFHVVLAMEWLAYADLHVRTELGFANTGKLTKTVRPHNQVKKRSDTWRSNEYLTADQYQEISLALALDEILTDAANRLFLERLVCDNLLESPPTNRQDQ